MFQFNIWFALAFIVLLVTILIIFILALARPCGEFVDDKKARNSKSSQIKILAARKQDSRVAIPGEYIVTMKQTSPHSPEALSQHFSKELSFEVHNVYRNAIRGFSGKVDESKLDEIRMHPSVSHVESDALISCNMMHLETSLSPTQWGIDQVCPGGPSQPAKEVDVYIVGEGARNKEVALVESKTFVIGNTCVDDSRRHGEAASARGTLERRVAGEASEDASGRGTHIAKIIGECSPGTKLHSLKVFDEEGRGKLSWTIAAVDYILERRNAEPLPMVGHVSFSFEVGTTEYNALDVAIDNCINQGIPFCVAAGDEGKEASLFSPGHVVSSFCVGGYTREGKIADFSNKGPGVFVLAPGSDEAMSGTATATAHITGIVASYLSEHPIATPGEIGEELLDLSGGIQTSL